MQVEWDSNKAYTNFQKHGIRFSDAEAVLYDPNALSFEDTRQPKVSKDLSQLAWIISGVYWLLSTQIAAIAFD